MLVLGVLLGRGRGHEDGGAVREGTGNARHARIIGKAGVAVSRWQGRIEEGLARILGRLCLDGAGLRL